jgi:hypothetical protein
MSATDFDSTYFVLDFDRCIGNTEKIHEILWAVIESETGILVDTLKATKRAMDAKGYAFDTVEYVAKELLNQRHALTWQELRELFIREAKTHDLLESGAGELLAYLDTQDIPYGILTYGRESWQLTKLEAAGLMEREIPFEITGIEHKGEILTSWKHGDEFIIPPALTRDFTPLTVRQIVFLDDKPRSFIGIPSGVRGICVRPGNHSLLPSQQGDLPGSVEEVWGLRGGIALLRLDNT